MAMLGFDMWLVYLQNCDPGDMKVYVPAPVLPGYLSGFAVRGFIPPTAEGPLKASRQGSRWREFISEVIGSCTRPQELRDLYELIDQNSKNFHRVSFLYQTLRKAGCSMFESKNPIENKTNMDLYLRQHPDEPYLSYFVTLMNPLEVGRINSSPFIQNEIKKNLISFGCSYCLFSYCYQEVPHIHGVITFTWPVHPSFVHSVLNRNQNFVLNKDRCPIQNSLWSIQPSFTDQDFGINYILNQENFYKREAPSFKFNFSPRYFSIHHDFWHAEDNYEYFEGFNNYSKRALRGKAPKIATRNEQKDFLIETFKEMGIVHLRNSHDKTEVENVLKNEFQKPVLYIHKNYEIKSDQQFVFNLKGGSYFYVCFD